MPRVFTAVAHFDTGHFGGTASFQEVKTTETKKIWF